MLRIHQVKPSPHGFGMYEVQPDYAEFDGSIDDYVEEALRHPHIHERLNRERECDVAEHTHYLNGDVGTIVGWVLGDGEEQFECVVEVGRHAE